MIDLLTENFKMRFREFYSYARNIRIFEISFSVEASDAPEKLKLQTPEMRHDSILSSSFNQGTFISVYASLPVSQFFEFSKLPRNVSYVFSNAYDREGTSSYETKQIAVVFNNKRCVPSVT
jgi:hypothetical protein